MKDPVILDVTPSVQICHLGGRRYRVRLVLGDGRISSYEMGDRWGRNRAERHGRKVLAKWVRSHAMPPVVATITTEDL